MFVFLEAGNLEIKDLFDLLDLFVQEEIKKESEQLGQNPDYSDSAVNA